MTDFSLSSLDSELSSSVLDDSSLDSAEAVTSSVVVDNSSGDSFDYQKGIYDNTYFILMLLCFIIGACLIYLFGRFIYNLIR